jgi:hypothetical protein
MGQQLTTFLGLDPSSLVAVSREQAPAPEPRPRDCSLDSSRWRMSFPDLPWPTYHQALSQQLAAGS